MTQITIKLQPVAESCTVRSFHSRRPGRKLLDTPSYFSRHSTPYYVMLLQGAQLWHFPASTVLNHIAKHPMLHPV